MNRIAATTLARPVARATVSRSAFVRPYSGGKPRNTDDKPKLRFRFGLRDVPVELYPVMFVVSVGVVGAAIAAVRHFSIDDLRLKPNAVMNKAQDEMKTR